MHVLTVGSSSNTVGRGVRGTGAFVGVGVGLGVGRRVGEIVGLGVEQHSPRTLHALFPMTSGSSFLLLFCQQSQQLSQLQLPFPIEIP